MNIDWKITLAAVWRRNSAQLRAVKYPDLVNIHNLIGIDTQKQQLIKNTERFIAGKPANNVLLWGARGTGKSSLIKAILNEYHQQGLRLIEIYKDDLACLPEIVDNVRESQEKYIIYCDDFSFEANENAYVALKTLLEGSIEKAPDNILLYATSNRRHLMPEFMKDNLDTKIIDGELHYSDAVEERISLSDRFGLWISFYPSDMQNYLNIVDNYFTDYAGDRDQLHEAAKMFAMARASKSGRTARQFFQYYDMPVNGEVK